MKNKFNRNIRGHKSYESSLNGVANYQQSFHPNIIEMKQDANQYFSSLGKLMKDFLNEIGSEMKCGGSYGSLTYNANLVQDNFKEFKKWLKNHPKNIN